MKIIKYIGKYQIYDMLSEARQKIGETRKHSSRICTTCLLTISHVSGERSVSTHPPNWWVLTPPARDPYPDPQSHNPHINRHTVKHAICDWMVTRGSEIIVLTASSVVKVGYCCLSVAARVAGTVGRIAYR